MTDQYDKLFDHLLEQDVGKETTVEITIETSVTPTAVRKALKQRMRTYVNSYAAIGLHPKYRHVTVSGNDGSVTIRLLKRLQSANTKFSFTLIPDSDESEAHNDSPECDKEKVSRFMEQFKD